MPQHGGNLKTLCRMKETRPRRSHIRGFHLHEIPKRGKSTGTESRAEVTRAGVRVMGSHCGIGRGTHCDGDRAIWGGEN